LLAELAHVRVDGAVENFGVAAKRLYELLARDDDFGALQKRRQQIELLSLELELAPLEQQNAFVEIELGARELDRARAGGEAVEMAARARAQLFLVDRFFQIVVGARREAAFDRLGRDL